MTTLRTQLLGCCEETRAIGALATYYVRMHAHARTKPRPWVGCSCDEFRTRKSRSASLRARHPGRARAADAAPPRRDAAPWLRRRGTAAGAAAGARAAAPSRP